MAESNSARTCINLGLALFGVLCSFGCAHGSSPDAKFRDPVVAAPEVVAAVAATESAEAPPTPLPSWREGSVKRALLDFVARVTEERGSGFVPPAERIAVFDNDGTLWTEQPVPAQLAFALDRVRVLAPQYPEWRQKQPFKAVLSGDAAALRRQSERGIAELVAATHAGMTSDEFSGIAAQWFGSARHPRFQRPYTDLVYQPMLEVLRYLDANGFRSYIVSGGGVEFMRAFSERVYGIPPEHVLGSSGKLQYELVGGTPVLRRLRQVDFVDNASGKVLGIQKVVGRRPILAFGNSDGDFEMLEWTTSGNPRPELGVLVHHTDAEREYAYDREFSVSPLSRALDEAPRRNWVVVDMKRDWSVIYPFEAPPDK